MRVRDIQRAVASYFHVTVTAQCGPSRMKRVSKVRQVTYWLARKLTNKSYPVIGRIVRRHHATVIHGVRRIDREVANQTQTGKQAEYLYRKLKKESRRAHGGS